MEQGDRHFQKFGYEGQTRDKMITREGAKLRESSLSFFKMHWA